MSTTSTAPQAYAADSDLDELLAAAQGAYTSENWARCETLAAELLERAEALQDLHAEIHAHVWLSHTAQRQNDHNRAAAHATSALTLSHGQGDKLLRARARIASARVGWAVGDNDQALQDLEAALPTCRTGEDAELLFDTLNLLGIVYGELGNTEASLDWHQRALTLAESTGQPRMRAISRANLAGREQDQGEQALNEGRVAEGEAALRRSLELNEVALAIAQQAGMARIQVVVLSNSGAALALLGRRAEALAAFERQRGLSGPGGDAVSHVQRAQYLALMYREAGELDEARRTAADGLAVGEQARAKNMLIPLYELASALAEQAGDLAQALNLYKRFHTLRSEHALNSAQQRAKVLAVRLETERALAEAAAERQQAQALRRANEELAQRAEALGRDALQDALTGLANRRRLDTYLALRHEAARASGAVLCVALIDLDHFKSVNDRYSHAVGDQALRQLGALLQAHCRAQDLAARYGGEEFLIALDEVTPEGALQICERLRQAVERHDWSALAPGLAVTASLGLTDVARHARLEDGLREADAQLYRAKQAGRNRVCYPEGGFAPTPSA
ncbi:GGDEF domain-containing protein [Roseateles sp. DAIF2]|uniref:tetratricopeptide repeat-containing diguanylate cyclase n=1 Tax=Roseateles sp. DAIF2 TaxID=2714952 RepID=UPI0018A27BE8|nr:GGDEF domain-containing protein [Roseateles sp. DAIF2]QPF72244.1 GGDEF domain-containing protein [Roseateles sp. DAIF2]